MQYVECGFDWLAVEGQTVLPAKATAASAANINFIFIQ